MCSGGNEWKEYGPTLKLTFRDISPTWVYIFSNSHDIKLCMKLALTLKSGEGQNWPLEPIWPN